MHTLVCGIVFCRLLCAATQLPAPQSLDPLQNGVHVSVRQSHHVPAGHVVSSLHPSNGWLGLAESCTQWVVPVSSLSMVQRWPVGQSVASCSSAHMAGKPLLELLTALELLTTLEPPALDALALVVVVLAPPAPPLPVAALDPLKMKVG